MCLSLVSLFGVVPFSSYSHQKFTEATEIESQNLFYFGGGGESGPLTERFQIFATKRFVRTDLRISARFREIGKTEVTK